MNKQKKKFREIIRTKALFLTWHQAMAELGMPLAEALEELNHEQKRINALPRRGKLQVELVGKLSRQLDERESALAERLGFELIRTFKFVREHEDCLTPAMRKLFLNGGKA